MSQLNIHMTSIFEKDLQKFMRLRHIKTKSEAIRLYILLHLRIFQVG